MKNSNLINVFILTLCTMLTSCSAVEGIFKAGMGVGMFIVIAVIVVIVGIILKARNK